MIDGKPPENPTVELERPPSWAISLTEKVTKLAGRVETAIDNGVDIVTRLDRTDERVEKLEKRAESNSMRAAVGSQADLSHEAALAEEISKRQQVEAELAEEKTRREKIEASMVTKADLATVTEKQTSAIVEVITIASKNPTVQKIAWAFAGLLLVAINAATTYLLKGH